MSGEKPAPTAAEIAEAREYLDGPSRRYVAPLPMEKAAVVLLAALDAAEAERKDAIGALDDAGVRCNPDDDLATRVEKLAKDRDEIARLWAGVCDLLWPNREPDDAFGVDDVRESVKELRESLDAAEARAEAAEERAESVHASWSKCLKLLATAERERGEARAALPPGAIVVSDTEETVERVARAIHAENVAACDGVTEWEDACESVRQFTMCQADAVLAALRESRP